MSCTDASARADLDALFLGTLTPEAATRLRAHCAACAPCRETYDRLSRVESALEGRALPRGREALLEGALFARLGLPAPAPVAQAVEPAPSPPARRPAPRSPRWALPTWARVAMPLAACAAVALVVVALRPQATEAPDGWQARSGGAASPWGVRAFCVSAGGQVLAEARPGGTLACPVGASVQFSATAPRAARLSLTAQPTPGAEPLVFTASALGSDVAVPAGVDVPLDFSTPVTADWLAGPLQVKATFTDGGAKVLGETHLTLVP